MGLLSLIRSILNVREQKRRESLTSEKSIKSITSIESSIKIDELSSEIRDLSKMVSEANVDPRDIVKPVLERLERHDSDVKERHEELTTLIKGEILDRLNRLHRLGDRSKSIKNILENLTRREKQIMRILLERGYLTYKEISQYLGISHLTVKTYINKMLKDAEKKKLIVKQRGKPRRVGVSEEFEGLVKKKKSIKTI